MAPFDRAAGPDVLYETDGWDNYAANRARIAEHIHGNGIANSVSLGGNIHTFYAGTVPLAQGSCDPVLSEIVTTSITASGGASERYNDVNGRREENPCMSYFDNRQRGYTLLEFSAERIVASLLVVNDVTIEDSPVGTLATLSVNAGSTGVTQGT
jgi:alkaline phosphatase D